MSNLSRRFFIQSLTLGIAAIFAPLKLLAAPKPKPTKLSGTDIKYAKLSEAQRIKLAKYWTETLGYPKDYTNSMIKNYAGR